MNQSCASKSCMEDRCCREARPLQTAANLHDKHVCMWTVCILSIPEEGQWTVIESDCSMRLRCSTGIGSDRSQSMSSNAAAHLCKVYGAMVTVSN